MIVKVIMFIPGIAIVRRNNARSSHGRVARSPDRGGGLPATGAAAAAPRRRARRRAPLPVPLPRPRRARGRPRRRLHVRPVGDQTMEIQHTESGVILKYGLRLVAALKYAVGGCADLSSRFFLYCIIFLSCQQCAKV